MASLTPLLWRCSAVKLSKAMWLNRFSQGDLSRYCKNNEYKIFSFQAVVRLPILWYQNFLHVLLSSSMSLYLLALFCCFSISNSTLL